MKFHLIRVCSLAAFLVSIILAPIGEVQAQGKKLPKCDAAPNGGYAQAIQILRDDRVASYFLEDISSNCNKGIATLTHPCKILPLLERDVVGPSLVKRVLLNTPTNQTALKASLALIAKGAPGLDLTKFVNPRGEIKKERVLAYLKGQSPDHTGTGGEPKIPPGKYDPWPFPTTSKGPTYTSCTSEQCCYVDTSADTAEKDPDTNEKKVDVVHSGVLMVGAMLPKDGGKGSSCSFVLLSNNLAITAAHCIFGQNAVQISDGRLYGPIPESNWPKEMNLRWAVWTPEPGASKQSVAKTLGTCAKKEPGELCDFTEIWPIRRLFPGPGVVPANGLPDLALVEFRAPNDLKFKDPALATLEFETSQGFSELTTVGYGYSEDYKECLPNSKKCRPVESPYGPQVGWIAPNAVVGLDMNVGRTPDIYTVTQIIESGKEVSMPCNADSGGGVFLGFINGNPSVTSRPQLLGIIQSKPSAVTKDNKPAGCKDTPTFLLPPKAYKGVICSQISRADQQRVGLESFCNGTFKEVEKP